MLKDKNILITGGTGSFGHAFTRECLKKYRPNKLIILSRDEMKQWNMARRFDDHKSLRFFIGDVRDKDRLSRALCDVDFVIHAAATKIVPTAEYNPFECIKTNIVGAMNVIEASLDRNVKKVVALSTDKASSPINLYGATKLASDKLFVSANNYSGKSGTIFSVVRYGNVMGSRGSVIPFFLSLKKDKKIPITDSEMTRFMISLDQGVDLVNFAFKDALGGEIYVKKIPSMKVVDIANAILPSSSHEIIGLRPGEKIHEQMIGIEDSQYTYEYKDYFKILPSINNWFKDSKRIKNGKKVSPNFTYTSDNNKDWMTKKELKAWVHLNLESMKELND